MRHIIPVLIITLAGCVWWDGTSGSSLKRNNSNPIATAGRSSSSSPVGGNQLASDVQLAGVFEAVEDEQNKLADPAGQVAQSIVARVNGDPILAEDLFGPIRPQLLQWKQTLQQAQYIQQRDALINRQLTNLIEQRLIVQEAERKLPEQAIARLKAMADGEFARKIEDEMKRMGVSTEAELRRKMAEAGQSLDQFKEFQREMYLSRQYINAQVGPRLSVSRRELVQYYEAHADEFREEGGVKWSEILVSTERHGSKTAALRRAQQIRSALQQGVDFAELARKESDGATAAKGGKWDLTTRGSYIVEAVDQAIFQIKVGQVSEPIEGPRGWHIVRVDQRIANRMQPLEEVQDEIQKTLREEKYRSESDRFLAGLRRSAHIVTVFDKAQKTR